MDSCSEVFCRALECQAQLSDRERQLRGQNCNDDFPAFRSSPSGAEVEFFCRWRIHDAFCSSELPLGFVMYRMRRIGPAPDGISCGEPKRDAPPQRLADCQSTRSLNLHAQIRPYENCGRYVRPPKLKHPPVVCLPVLVAATKVEGTDLGRRSSISLLSTPPMQ